MAGQLLLINPKRRRRAARSSNPKRRRARARRGNPMVAARVHRRVMRANPRRRYSMARRHNPIRHRRRSRNPIGGSFMNAAGSMVKTAALGAVGSAGVNALMSYVMPMLPATVNTGPSYAAIKALITIALGVYGRKMSPMVPEMAQGALTVQAALFLTSQLGATLPTDGALGYYTSGVQVRGRAGNRLLPSRGMSGQNMGMYLKPAGMAGMGRMGGGAGTIGEMGGSVYR
jgi:uncharacterized membrane protein YgdD (TMEM256/DUF423 family)